MEIAQQYLEGIREYSYRSLGDSVNHPDLAKPAVYARLSDLIDGKFAQRSTSGKFKLAPAIVTHALAIALLKHLDELKSQTFEALTAN